VPTDLTKGIDLSPRDGTDPIALPSDKYLEPSTLQLVGSTRSFLQGRGYDLRTITDLTTPGRTPSAGDLSSIYTQLKPTLQGNLAATHEMLKLVKTMDDQGITVKPDQQLAISSILKRFEVEQGAKVSGVTDLKKIWDRAMQRAGDVIGGVTAEGINQLALGLASLDIVTRFDNSVMLKGITNPRKREELRALALPKVTLGTKEYSIGLVAALDLQFQRLVGLTESGMAGPAAQAMGKLLNIPALSEAGQDTSARGRERYVQATRQAPALIAGLSKPILFHDVLEANWDEVTDVDSIYKNIDDVGGHAGLAMAAGLLAVGDLILAPSAFVGSGIQKAVPMLQRGGQAILRRTAPEAAVGTIAKIARRTYSVEDALASVKESESYVKNVRQAVNEEMASNAASTGSEMVSLDSYKRLVAAESAHNNELAWFEQFKAVDVPDEVVIKKTSRRNPLFIPDLKLTRKALRQIKSKYEAPEAIVKELHGERIKTLKSDFDGNTDWVQGRNQTELFTDPTFQQRHVLGPDDAEQTGDILNTMARTGGLSMDDFALTPIAPEYSVMPDQVPQLKWSNHDAAGDILDTERGIAEVVKGRQYSLFESTHRTLARQEDIVRRRLGAARRVGEKTVIPQLEKELANVKGLRQKLISQKGLSDDKYDDIWLPKQEPGIMEDPGKFNRWLTKSADRVMESLYPGGLMYVNGTDRAFQLMAPFREPRRFMQTYAPEAWDRIRAAYWGYNERHGWWTNKVREVLLDAGVLTKKPIFDPTKHFSPHDISREKNAVLFTMLDTEPSQWDAIGLTKSITPKLQKAHDEIRSILEYGAKLQGLSSGTNPPKLTGYIKHVFTKDQMSNGRRPLEYVGMPRKAEVFAAHLLDRAGAEGYAHDAVSALDLYGRAMYRKTILEPAFEDMVETGRVLAARHDNPNFQTYMNMFVSQLKGEPTLFGRLMDDWIGGAVNKGGKTKWKPGQIDRTLMGATTLVYANLLGGNPRYGPMQIASGILTTSSRYGLWRTMRGLFMQASREGQALSKEAGVYKAYADIFESAPLKSWAEIVQKIPILTPVGLVSNAGAELFSRGVTFHASLDSQLTKFGFSTLGEATSAGWGRRIVFEAVKSSEEVNHMFGAMGRSPWATRTFGGSQGMALWATQFLSYMPKQTEELMSQFAKNPGNLGLYLSLSGYLAHTAARDFGIDVTDYVGLGYLPETPLDLTSPGVDALIGGLELTEAVAQYDPELVARRGTNWVNLLAKSFIPGVAAALNTVASVQKLSSGMVRRPSGAKVRDIAMPGELGSAEGIATALQPGVGPPGMGGELLPLIFRQPSIREALETRAQREAVRETKRNFHQIQRFVRDYVAAVEGQDWEAEERLLKELDAGKVRLTSTTPIERAIEARYLDERLRLIEQNPSLIDKYMDIFNNYGLDITTEQPQ
jgi:hypothetical protein